MLKKQLVGILVVLSLVVSGSICSGATVYENGLESGNTFAANNVDTSENEGWLLSTSGYGNPGNYTWGGGGTGGPEDIISGVLKMDTGYAIQVNDLLDLKFDIRRLTEGMDFNSSVLATLYYVDGDAVVIGSMELHDDQLAYGWQPDLVGFSAKVPVSAVGKTLWIKFQGGPNSWNGTSAQRLGLDNFSVSQSSSLKAVNMYPADGDDGIESNDMIQWEVARNSSNINQPHTSITSIDIYYGTDPNVNNMVKVTKSASTQSFTPAGGFDTDTLYYWRVDTNTTSGTIEGDMWSFETIKMVPVVQSGPDDVFVPEGELAELTIDASSSTTVSYAWYKGAVGDTSVSVGTNAPTLSFDPVTVANEGSYWCRMTNAAGTSDSDAALLTVSRTLGLWTFEGNLDNEIDSVHFGTAAVDPNFVDDGIDGGQALDIYPGGIVTIADSSDMYNTPSFSVTYWLRSGNTASVSGAISKRSTDGPYTGWWSGFSSTHAYGVMDGVGTVSGRAILDNKWHMLVLQYSHVTNTFEFFLDGSIVGTASNETPFAHSNTPLIIGTASETSTSFVTGQVDDVRITNYPISAYDIANEYATLSGKVACYKYPQFDVASPDGIDVPDCKVNLYDFAQFMAEWMECNLLPTSACANN